uniref:Uncharacterized protein n=1 Tax=Thermosporothrix sp. COM3 TaxID=2490863 RepID=A0A455ST47_9CHLR|nr:hypothetical protein KTC_40560 [Thermosporothrix sp. COM3]
MEPVLRFFEQRDRRWLRRANGFRFPDKCFGMVGTDPDERLVRTREALASCQQALLVRC